MRKLIVSIFLFAAAFCAASTAASAQFKLGTVDMNKVFTAYFKTKDAEDKINDAKCGREKGAGRSPGNLEEGDGRN